MRTFLLAALPSSTIPPHCLSYRAHPCISRLGSSLTILFVNTFFQPRRNSILEESRSVIAVVFFVHPPPPPFSKHTALRGPLLCDPTM
jgi:hypothetical protein